MACIFSKSQLHEVFSIDQCKIDALKIQICSPNCLTYSQNLTITYALVIKLRYWHLLPECDIIIQVILLFILYLLFQYGSFFMQRVMGSSASEKEQNNAKHARITNPIMIRYQTLGKRSKQKNVYGDYAMSVNSTGK